MLSYEIKENKGKEVMNFVFLYKFLFMMSDDHQHLLYVHVHYRFSFVDLSIVVRGEMQ